MADESKTGILGRLPPLPRPALNNSVIGMEQAYRQRKGLTLLTDADIEALKAGQPMPWEVGGAAPAPSAAAAAAVASAPVAAPPAAVSSPAAPASAAPAASAGTISEEVAKWVAEGRKWSKSTIAAEQARRGRKGLPALNNAEMSALLGEPVEASAPPAAAPAAPLLHPLLPLLPYRAALSAQKLPSGWRKERSGASRQSPPNRRGAAERAYQR